MDLTLLFCDVDDFVNQYKKESMKQIENNYKKYHRNSKLSESEIITICILFHQSSYRNFKAFYLEYVIKQSSSFFPKLVSYIVRILIWCSTSFYVFYKNANIYNRHELLHRFFIYIDSQNHRHRKIIM